MHVGRVRAQAASRWLPTAAARVLARVWSCVICGGQSGAGAGRLRVLRIPLPIFILPITWGWYNRPVVAAVASGLSLTPLRIINCLMHTLEFLPSFWILPTRAAVGRWSTFVELGCTSVVFAAGYRSANEDCDNSLCVYRQKSLWTCCRCFSASPLRLILVVPLNAYFFIRKLQAVRSSVGSHGRTPESQVDVLFWVGLD
jgi:hypothetical protein